MLRSNYYPLCSIEFPKYDARQYYMLAFELSDVTMPKGYEWYTVPVTRLVAAATKLGAPARGTAYLTVDEKVVQAGMSQRRPKPHVDGCFSPEGGNWGHTPTWNHYCNNIPLKRMSVIVAASVAGCRAWKGEFEAEPKNDGDLSHIKLGQGEILRPNFGYLLSPDCVHESMIFNSDTQRSFIRIALPII